jgi:hypothetical protein
MAMFFCGVYVTALLGVLVFAVVWSQARTRTAGQCRPRRLYVTTRGLDLLEPAPPAAPTRSVPCALPVRIPRQNFGLVH